MPRFLDAVAPAREAMSASAPARPVGNSAAYPFRTHGRIFASDPSIGDYTCSATVVPSQAKNVVWTAGHCLTNEGVWAEEVIFVPAYEEGVAPYGRWAAEWYAAPREWAVYNNFNFDYGVMVMHPDSAGNEIADVVGWRGIAFGESKDQYFYSFGYPGQGRFDGETPWRCDSPYLGDDPWPDPNGEPAMAIECDMTQGSSGGGWIIGDVDSESSYLNSVNSFGMEIYPDVMFGPYLDSYAEDLWVYAAGSSEPTPLPTPTESVESHEMRLSLQLRRHLVSQGAMTAPDGYLPCTRRAPVGIFRKVPSGWRLLKVTETNDLGRFRVGISDRPGRYVAYSLDGYVDDLNYCTDSISGVRTHGH